jgi:hypothetical protein
MTSKLSIDKFQVYSGETSDDVRVLAYEGRADIVRELEDTAAIMVRLDLDGMTDEVTLDGGPSNDVHSLTRARDALTAVIERLELLYAGAADEAVRGRCMAQGGWGRCLAEHGHEGDHKMPTEAEWRSLNALTIPGLLEAVEETP